MRFLALVLLFLSILYLPYWFSVFLVVLFAFSFKLYLEAIFLAFWGDLLYLPGRASLLFGHKYLLIFTIIVVLIELLKRRLKFYEDER